MKRSEFIRRTNEAIAHGAGSARWGYAAEHGNLPAWEDNCGLCVLKNELCDEKGISQGFYDPHFCVLQYAEGRDRELEQPGQCCREWRKWCCAEAHGQPADRREAAAAMIARLNACDAAVCAENLVQDGILEEDEPEVQSA